MDELLAIHNLVKLSSFYPSAMRSRSLNGEHLIVATNPSFPSTHYGFDEETAQWIPPMGYEDTMTQVLAWKFNFSFQLLYSDDSWGSLMDNGTRISGICGNVHESRADFGIGSISMTLDRLRFVDFIWLMPEDYTIMTPRSVASWPKWAVITLLPANVWLCLFASIWLLSGMLFLSHILHHPPKLDRHGRGWMMRMGCELAALYKTYAEYWLEVIKASLEGGFQLPAYATVRLFWAFCALWLKLLSTVYSADLKAEMATLHFDASDSLSKLIDRISTGSTVISLHQGYWTWAYFKEQAAKYPLGHPDQTPSSIIGHLMVPRRDLSRGLVDGFFEAVGHYAKLGQTLAYLDTTNDLLAAYYQHPDHVFVPHETIRLLENPTGIPVRYGSPLKPLFEPVVRNIHESGLFSYWRQIAFQNTASGELINSEDDDDEQFFGSDQMELGHLTSISIVCLIIVLVACIQLAGEMVWRLHWSNLWIKMEANVRLIVGYKNRRGRRRLPLGPIIFIICAAFVAAVYFSLPH